MELTKTDIEQFDTQQMWDLLAGFPNQWDEAIKITEELDLRLDPERIENVCIAGMGGSAIGGDLIRAYSSDSCPVPVHVNRDYAVPGWVDERTLFIASSFSGNTEETLSALTLAVERGAQPAAVTSGGELLRKAVREQFDCIKIPGGMPPRAALGYNFVSLFRIFQQLDYLDEGDEALSETEVLLSDQGALLADLEESEALALARDLMDSLPIIYSNSTLLEPVNLRWRCQFEENSKILAYGNTLPEMNHNEIVGWEHIAHLTGRLSVILLIDEQEDPRITKRMHIVKELIEDQASSLTILKARGESRLSRMFSLVQFADWTSYYLAILNEVDPTPIAKIDLLKSKLSE